MLWLWRRLVATAQIRPLAWEPPYAMGVALEKAKRQKKKRKKKEKKQEDGSKGWLRESGTRVVVHKGIRVIYTTGK